jgi:hypothetical protein
MRQGLLRDISPLRQLTRQACLRASNASGNEGRFSGLVSAKLLFLAQYAPLATVADDAEQPGF